MTFNPPFTNSIIGLLRVAALLCSVVCTVSVAGLYVVLAPKILRPGLDSNIQYNLRHVVNDVEITTKIIQNNVVKTTLRHKYSAGMYERGAVVYV